MRESGADALHRADLVDGNDFLDFLVVKLVDGGQPGVENAGVVDENVDLTEMLHRGFHEILTILVLGNIGGHGENLSALRTDLLGNLVQRGLTAGADDDVGAALGKQKGGGRAYARVASCDDSCFSL